MFFDRDAQTYWHSMGRANCLTNRSHKFRSPDDGLQITRSSNPVAAFARRSDCRVCGIVAAAAALRANGLPVHLIGDSVTEQIGADFVRALAMTNSSGPQLPVFSTKYNQMLPDTDAEMVSRFEHGSPEMGTAFFNRQRPAHTNVTPEATSRHHGEANSSVTAEGHAGILVYNVGLWYNLACLSDEVCSFDERHVDYALATWREGGVIQSCWQDGSDDGGGGSTVWGEQTQPRDTTTIFNNREKRPLSVAPERCFANHVLRLALWTEANRAQLPRHIFWLDSTPQHHPGAGVFRGDAHTKPRGVHANGCAPPAAASQQWWHWREIVSRRIWHAVSPSTPFFHASRGPLKDRGQDHRLYDCTHFCEESEGWNEHVASVLTALVAATVPNTAAAAAAAAAAISERQASLARFPAEIAAADAEVTAAQARAAELRAAQKKAELELERNVGPTP